ncbi:hypothetical protein ACFOKF_15300 [Sphingobium rhizovicinum]|uniref:Uncharacterized protein n=1 Tax=Sphingobium rhizovicinum TaxID=432308 RepID=A0ABV7NHP9_9SPHN
MSKAIETLSSEDKAAMAAALGDIDAYASAAQGDKADTAVQPGDLAAVATSGAYADLDGKPALGTAAAQDSTAFATAAQGGKADSAVQPADLAAGLAGKASTAQGAKADSALQPGASVEVLADSADYKRMTAAERTKLAGVAAGAQVNTVASVAGKTGAVTLGKGDVGLPAVDNTADADKPISTATAAALAGKATIAQGAKADSAVQPADLAAVATSGAYGDLDGKPALGSAAGQNINAFASAAQGAKADSALQAGASIEQLAETADYKRMTAAERTKLAGIAAGAQPNTVASVAGKTGAVTLGKGDVGLPAVDNTADADKPISTATAAALAGKATVAQGAKADSAVQPADLAAGLAGKASAAQGAKADSALQPGASIEQLADAAGFKRMTAAERAKLDGVAAGAQVNTVASVAGKTGAVTLGKGDVGLPAVDNTADADKPISTAAAAALAGKASTVQLSAETTRAQGIEQALDTRLAAVEPLHALVPRYPDRAGDARALFSTALTGNPVTRATITAGVLAQVDSVGSVLRIRGQDTDASGGYVDIAPRIARPLYAGRTYRLIFRLRRNADPADPANNAIELRWQNLNANMNNVSNVRLGNVLLPIAADGVVTASFLIGKAGAPGTLAYTVPPTAVYGLPHIRVYGNGQETDIISIEIEDATDNAGIDLPALSGSVAALGTGLAAETQARTTDVASLQQGHAAQAAILAGLGTAAQQPATAFATSGQGVKADSALQPGAPQTSIAGLVASIASADFASAFAPFLTRRNGVWSLVDDLVWIDDLGRMGVQELTIGRNPEPTTIKNGVVVHERAENGDPTRWYDRRTGRERLAGDMWDRPERLPAGSPFAVTAGRDLVTAMGKDGLLWEPASVDAPMAYTRLVDDGGGPVEQVFVALGQSVARLTAGMVDCFAAKVIAPGLVKYAKANGRMAVARFFQEKAGDPNHVDMFPEHGQSVNLGTSDGGAALQGPVTLPFPPDPDVIMFNGSIRAAAGPTAYVPANFASFTPAYEQWGPPADNVRGDTGYTAFGFSLRRAIAPQVLLAATGNGGTAFETLGPGTQMWSNMLYGVQRGKELATAAGKTFAVPAMLWRHGETPATDTPATEVAQLGTLADAVQVDIPAITGQAKPPLIVLQQINFCYNTDGTGLYHLFGPGEAQGTVGLNDPRFLLCGPQYPSLFTGSYHMSPEGFAYMGSMQEKAVRRHLYQDMPWKPVHMASAILDGRWIIVRFAGGMLDYGGRLTVDTRRVTDPGRLGFAYVDSNMSALVASAEPLGNNGANEFAVRLTAAPSGSGRSLGLAHWAPWTSSAPATGPTSGLRSPIHDNDPECCRVTGLPLHNYPISQIIGVI